MFTGIRRVANESIIAAVGAYRTTSSQALTQNDWTTIIFNAEHFDAGGNYNASTGVFTAPVAGYYTIDTAIQTDATQLNFAIRKNGSNLYTLNDTADASKSMGGTVECAAGDTITVAAYTTEASKNAVVGGNGNETNLSIVFSGRS